ncbi:3-methyl-2-oxobutanoate hydroxymethyltransferase [Desulfofundulus thermobenzoicus]|uniref:3-methyl-2-oxobutanoate hydroxymethyltransferase n=1 Tax=Desulfofundulus thermobenzoicus TaxID=29376 RepID=A0A6N7IP14_9FIRM|nr:3-methyl-2-oxobutanoate hydroxymethyltransferase [Desulfofundulus thermobenzoicus]MQL51641.1 3-methyl-2-oxobutanoate hydroxymethyltransferase [Desulfofundulus thermobenzoicus]
MARVDAAYLIQKKSSGNKITLSIVYDFSTAQAADQAGIDILLVNDDVNMLLYGESHVTSTTVEQMVYHARAVSRAADRAQVVLDLPASMLQMERGDFLRRLETVFAETGVQAVKIEGGAEAVSLIREASALGIPVMGHIGLNPKRLSDLVHCTAQGKTREQAAELLKVAREVEKAGVYAVLLDAVTEETAACITEELSIPTIGIGSGRKCDGVGLVSFDLLGITPGRVPKFVKKYCHAREEFVEAFKCFVRDVREGRYPGPEHVYRARERIICHKLKE